MKEFIGAVAALLLCLSVVIFSYFYTANSIDGMRKSLEELPLTIDEDVDKNTSERYLGCVSDSIEILDKRMGKLSLFISHKELDELNSMMSAVISAIESRDSGHYAASVSSLRERLEKLADSEGISLSAIF
ncbi:MAG: DUF4363 family protein [Clostridia bacterium]|nr:DUF4363 family protein [Clostridia bacterium]